MPEPEDVLIIHRVPYEKINYHEVIDHDAYAVHYILVKGKTDDVPDDIPHHVAVVSEANFIEDVLFYVHSVGLDVKNVVALSEYNLISAEIIRNVLGLASRKPVYDVLKYRDKHIMKRHVAEAGVRCPQSALLSNGAPQDLLETWVKIVFKPTAGAASENTHIFDSYTEFVQSDRVAAAIKSGARCLIEEYVAGDICHFDGLVSNGKIVVAIGSRYLGNCFDFTLGQPLASVQMDDTSQYNEWIAKCLNAVGIANGAFHLEGILSGDEIVFLEVANRAGGAGVVTCTQLSTGLNMMQEEVRMAMLGQDYKTPEITTKQDQFGWFVVPAATYQNGFDKETRFQGSPNIVSLNINASPQNIGGISYAENNNPCTGIVRGNSSKTCVQTIDNIFGLATNTAATLGPRI